MIRDTQHVRNAVRYRSDDLYVPILREPKTTRLKLKKLFWLKNVSSYLTYASR